MRRGVPKSKAHPRPASGRALRERVGELEETLRAIQCGEVDALIVGQGGRERVFTLDGADSAFRMIVEQMSEGALTIRPEGTVLYCNKRFAEMLGLPLESVIGSPVSRFAAPQSRAALKQLVAAALKRPARSELAFTAAAGKSIPVLVSMSGLRDYAVPALCVSVADLTAQKREALLSAFTGELEARVLVRTRELSRANRELEAFSYSASHDLRGPLRAISGYEDLLTSKLKGRLEPAEAGYLDSIRRAVARMAQIIDSLLALSRATKAELIDEKVDLSKMALEVGGELVSADPARKVALKIERGLRARGDPRLLRQVMQNLLGNAWKFTSKRKSAHVEFKSVRVDGARAYCVKDDGAGFEMAYVDKIFRPFQRLHAEFEGVGIGLTLVQRIIERHGGRVWAKGRSGRGAEFFFTLGRSTGESHE